MYEVQIAAGQALLDEKAPGWRSKINYETLDLNDTGRCVLAQVYGSYKKGCDVLFPDPEHDDYLFTSYAQELEADKYGFNVNVYEVRHCDENLVILTREWLRAI